jgi:proteasome lid subunit RPN8/RPN11
VKVILAADQRKILEAYLEAGYPNEAAGFLLGTLTASTFDVKAVLPLENRWDTGSQRNRFRLEPQDTFKAELEAEKQGLDVIGVFHSHPDHPAQPSQWDLAWATWPNFAFLITTVAEGQAVVTRAWRLKDDRSAFIEDEIVTV